ncbi:MAG: hypothetical protein SGPRY_003847 [Prymnesium sp.]
MHCYLPVEFNSKLKDFVFALRALKWPVFKDQVIASANTVLQGSNVLDKYKDKQLGSNWYCSTFMKEWSHVLGKATIKPLEINRAR